MKKVIKLFAFTSFACYLCIIVKKQTNKDMNKASIFTQAHKIAKQTRKEFVSYRLAFKTALKIVWASKNNPFANAPENYQEALKQIADGADFNGKVYRKNNGRRWCMMFIYLDGKLVSLGSTYQSEFTEDSNKFLEYVVAPSEKIEAKQENKKWIKPTIQNTGHFVYSTGNYTEDVLSGYYEEN